MDEEKQALGRAQAQAIPGPGPSTLRARALALADSGVRGLGALGGMGGLIRRKKVLVLAVLLLVLFAVVVRQDGLQQRDRGRWGDDESSELEDYPLSKTLTLMGYQILGSRSVRMEYIALLALPMSNVVPAPAPSHGYSLSPKHHYPVGVSTWTHPNSLLDYDPSRPTLRPRASSPSLS
jgi:hypothetical protein